MHAPTYTRGFRVPLSFGGCEYHLCPSEAEVALKLIWQENGPKVNSKWFWVCFSDDRGCHNKEATMVFLLFYYFFLYIYFIAKDPFCEKFCLRVLFLQCNTFSFFFFVPVLFFQLYRTSNIIWGFYLKGYIVMGYSTCIYLMSFRLNTRTLFTLPCQLVQSEKNLKFIPKCD